MRPGIVWFRQDLRLHDNAALHAAVARGAPLVLVYILEEHGPWRAGAAMRYWLHQSLAALAAELARHGQRLLLLRGDARRELARLREACDADALYFNRRYEAHDRAVDGDVERALHGMCEVRAFASHLLFEPDAVRTASGGPYRVFTPYYRACLQLPSPRAPLPAPARWPPGAATPPGLALHELQLEPRIPWAGGIAARWPAGEHAAHVALDEFIDERMHDYARDRDRPSLNGTAGMSPYLAIGAVSARSCWHAAQQAALVAREAGRLSAAEAWTRQLIWREFAYHLLHHFPHTESAPFRAEWQAFPWLHDAVALRRWQRGMTGIPLVDAGMRELWHSGYMHNRVRMVVASWLCKHLGQHWLAGARWFWDTLIDADLANNTLGWQWSAGCGADAAPYFRIFNPVSQSLKFDAAGNYLRRWLPERAALDDKAIHDPAVRVPGYPSAMVDLAQGRQQALARYAALPR
ncbi:MAG: deoxyribodipyrimidine photo-lyase [Proteobacteria bacterium]|nr:deoxyribodipyrimidine photo-lyase [Pseudomonadota bacterium]